MAAEKNQGYAPRSCGNWRRLITKISRGREFESQHPDIPKVDNFPDLFDVKMSRQKDRPTLTEKEAGMDHFFKKYD